jgi:hypothetical protein
MGVQVLSRFFQVLFNPTLNASTPPPIREKRPRSRCSERLAMRLGRWVGLASQLQNDAVPLFAREMPHEWGDFVWKSSRYRQSLNFLALSPLDG